MADNIATPVPAGTIMKTKDLGGGVQLPQNSLLDAAGNEVLGQAVASPDANTIGGRLKGILDKLLGSIAVTGTFWQATQPVSAAALPLPAGAATAAAQGTGNASLANVEPAGTVVAITPSDSTTLAIRGLYVGVAGDVAVIVGGVTVTFKAVPAGTILPIKATKVMATNTTATNMIGLG